MYFWNPYSKPKKRLQTKMTNKSKILLPIDFTSKIKPFQPFLDVTKLNILTESICISYLGVERCNRGKTLIIGKDSPLVDIVTFT